MLGTLYGTVEIACSIADEILRSFVGHWTEDRTRRLRRGIMGWCASVAILILSWLFVRQSTTFTPTETEVVAKISVSSVDDAKLHETAVKTPVKSVEKPRLLLTLMTPVNLFTGVLFCGVICLLTIWMDQKWLPPELRPPGYLTALNFCAGLLFLALGLKGIWDNENRLISVGGLSFLFLLSLVIAVVIRLKPASEPTSIPRSLGESAL